MFNLINSDNVYSAPIVGSYPTFEAAKAAAHDLLPVLYFEVDDDHDGCADLITEYGTLYMIEPAERRA